MDRNCVNRSVYDAAFGNYDGIDRRVFDIAFGHFGPIDLTVFDIINKIGPAGDNAGTLGMVFQERVIYPVLDVP